MRTKILISVPIAVLLTIFTTAILYNVDSTVKGQAPPPNYDEDYSFGQLNVKARAVNEGGDATAVAALVDELFNTFSTVVASDVKSRIVNSEIRYQTHQRGGVAEVEVVEAVNGLQIKFNTPEFSKTDLYEVRKLRQALQLFAPQFVGHGRQSEQSFVNDVNPTIVPEMSPSEAVFVVLAMVYQKQRNPNYQITISERNAQWAESHDLKGSQALEPNPERTKNFADAVYSKTETMSPTELLAIPHRALDILGIEQ